MLQRAAVVVGAVLALAFSALAATFTKDVAPILQAKCQECHRPDSIAPMSLLTYEQARPWAKSIKQRVVTRQMPPWHIDKTVGIQQFKNDFSLTDQEIATIVAWVDAGAPQGDPKDMPPAREFPDYKGWNLAKELGEPELILKSEDYTMPAKAQDAWFRPVTNIPVTEARWVRAVEIRPGTPKGRKIMHHVLARLQQGETDDATAGIGGLLMEWAVNKNYDLYRPDTGKLITPGSRISWELHLHAVGEEIRDHAEIGIYLYPKGQEPKHRTSLNIFTATSSFQGEQVIDLPPNSISETQNFHVLRQNAQLQNFQPHMHLRGKAMSMEAILPDGRKQVLSYVDKFNFNWMTNYIYADDAAPVLPKGTVLVIRAWHDNTANNPNNPDPNQWVGYGDRTVDEMAHAWVNINYLTDEEYQEYLSKQKESAPRATPARAAR